MTCWGTYGNGRETGTMTSTMRSLRQWTQPAHFRYSPDRIGSGPLQNRATTVFGDGQTFHSGSLGCLDTVHGIFTHQNVASLNVKTIGRHAENSWIWFSFSYVITGYDCVK